VTGPGIFGLTDTSYNLFLRLMGAKIGRRAVVGRLVRIADFDMLTIHDDAAVDDYAHVRAAEVRRGALRVAPVHIGAGATVCTRAVLGPGGIVPAAGASTRSLFSST
jgi:acetyltransferase-like isoleucine patch superfamily enzyme